MLSRCAGGCASLTGRRGNYLATTRVPAGRVKEEKLSVAARTLRAVEPARRVGAAAGARGECEEARELQTCVFTREEAAPHTPEVVRL